MLQLKKGDRVEVLTERGVLYRGTSIGDGLVWLDQLPCGATSHRAIVPLNVRKINQPPRRLSKMEMVAAAFPAGVGVMINLSGHRDQHWVVVRTASEEYPGLFLRFWEWAKEREGYIPRDTEVAAQDVFKVLRRTRLPASSRFYRLGND